jgi:hypothetical protein
MVGLILKLWLFIVILLVGALVILDLTGVAKPGTLSFVQPNVAPCKRLAQADSRGPHVVEVRWIWEPKAYGWGCYFEYNISDTRTVIPMPK